MSNALEGAWNILPEGTQDAVKLFAVGGAILLAWPLIMRAIGSTATSTPKIIDGGGQVVGVVIRSLTTKPIGFIRKMAKDVRGV
jgi:hypothetical protein